jgi:hypothetical protein
MKPGITLKDEKPSRVTGSRSSWNGSNCFKGSSSFEYTADAIAGNDDTMCTLKTFTVPSILSPSSNHPYEGPGVVRAQISVLKSERWEC